MPEIVEDTKNEVESNWKGSLAYGLGTGLGSMTFGPLGYAAGAYVSGAYIGGNTGNAMSTIGGGEAVRTLLTQGMGASTGGGGGRRRI